MKSLNDMYKEMRKNCDKSLIKGRDLVLFKSAIDLIKNMDLEARIAGFFVNKKIKTESDDLESVSYPREPRNYEKIYLEVLGPYEARNDLFTYVKKAGL